MPRSPSEMLRKSLKNCSSSDVSIVFDFDSKELEEFLFSNLSAFCQDSDVIQSARRESVGLAQRLNNTNNHSNKNRRSSSSDNSYHCQCCRNDIETIIGILDAFMNTSPMLPTKMVYQAHTFRGLLWMKCSSTSQSCLVAAQSAFTKALWIAASSVDDSVSQEEVALTMHRLGRLKGKQGHYQEAITLLEKASEKYEQRNTRQAHPEKQSNVGGSNNSTMSQLLLNAYTDDARNASGDFDCERKAAATKKLRQSSTGVSRRRRSPPFARKTLSLVQEERSSREFQLKH